MEDIFLFIFAVWFIFVAMPWWLLFGSIYGVFIAVISFFGYAIQAFRHLDLGGVGLSEDFTQGLILLFVTSPIFAVWDGLKASIEPVSYLWNFARYDHPFWAFVISVVLIKFYNRDNNEY